MVVRVLNYVIGLNIRPVKEMCSDCICKQSKRQWTKLVPMLKFMLPVMLVQAMQSIAQTGFYASLGSNPLVMDAVAKFGIAYSLLNVMSAGMQGFFDIAILRIKTLSDLKTACRCFCAIALFLMTAVFFMCITVTGERIFLHLFKLDTHIIQSTQYILLRLLLVIPARGINKTLAGIFIQQKRSLFITIVSTVEVVMNIGSVILLMRTSLPTHNPLAVPVIALYAGLLASVPVSSILFLYYVFPNMPPKHSASGNDLTVKSFLRLYVPLVILSIVATSAFPLSKTIMTQSTNLSLEEKSEAIALSTVGFSVGNVLFGCMYSLQATFISFGAQKSEDDHRKEDTSTTSSEESISLESCGCGIKYTLWDFYVMVLLVNILSILVYSPLLFQSVANLVFVEIIGMPKEKTFILMTLMKLFTFNILIAPFECLFRSLILLRGQSSTLPLTMVTKLAGIVACLHLSRHSRLHGAVQIFLASVIGNVCETSSLLLILIVNRLQKKATSVGYASVNKNEVFN